MSTPPPAANPPSRTRPFSDVPELGRRAAELLLTPNAMAPLSLEDASVVVAHMRLVTYARGVVMMHEGEKQHLDHMLLVLEGQVSVSSQPPGGGPSIEISVLGPGALIGEMALLDNAPRSTTCTALTSIQAAGMSRKAMELLLERHPGVAARLMVGLCCRLSERLRAMSDQLRLSATIAPGR